MKIEFSKVCIVVVNYNSSSDVILLLEQLRKLKGGSEKLIVIVDSNSEEKDKEKIRENLKGEVFIELNSNVGFGASANFGIKKGFEWGADYFLILNPDVKVEEDFLTKLLIALQAQKKCGIAVPLVLSWDGQKVQSLGGSFSLYNGRAVRRYYNCGIEKVPKDFEYVDFPIGCAFLVKREFLEDVGLLVENFFLYYEDVEIGLRAKREFWKVVAIPTSKIYHKDTTKERMYDPLINYLAIRNQIWVERIYANPFQLMTFMLFNFLLRYPYKTFKTIMFFRLKTFVFILRGIFAGLFSKKLKNFNHLYVPKKSLILKKDDVPQVPSIIFDNKDEK